MTRPVASAAPPRACIGFGHVWHRRLRPRENSFRYRHYFLMLPMRALRERPEPALHRNRRAALSFHDADHGDGRADALAWFDDVLAAEGLAGEASGEVWLQTYPRVLGHTFKPVSFWLAQRRDGTLGAVLAEVNNTFGERHAYLVSGDALRAGGELQARKVFHVSPFCTLEGHYRFRFELDAEGAAPRRIAVRIDHHDADGPLLLTGSDGALEALDARSARRALLGMPLLTLGVVARIHWQALRLAAKRVPFHRQPPAPERFVTR